MFSRTAIAILALSVVAAMQFKLPLPDFRKDITLDPNEDMASYTPETLKALGFGYDRAMSSMLWLRFLQSTMQSKVQPNKVSWLYRDLKTISEIDPDFYPIYEHGGIFLSVITEDKKGAEHIFLKGIEHFPTRWRIRAFLAYHYQFELQDIEKAGEQYKIGATLPGAPPILAILASNFMSKNGSKAGVEMLREFLKNTKDPKAREKLEEKIRKLEAKG